MIRALVAHLCWLGRLVRWAITVPKVDRLARQGVDEESISLLCLRHEAKLPRRPGR